MKKVYITGKIPELCEKMLHKKGFEVHVNTSDGNLTKTELGAVFSKYDAVVTLMTDKVGEEVINRASGNLKIIANYAVGFDNIDVLHAKRRGIVVCNTPGVAGESVAEHTFGLILACVKKLIEADKFVRSNKYHRWDPMAFLSPQVWGKTLGIIGLGRIGTFAAHIGFDGFRMKVLYYDIVRSEDFEMITEAKFTKLDNLLAEADFVTIHLPLMKSTYHLIGKRELKLMKKDAVLINTARGPIIDEEALIWALKSGEIAAAGLDVYEHEPSIERELRALPNVVLTPHTASATVETREAMARLVAQNIIDLFEGKTPFGLVKIA